MRRIAGKKGAALVWAVIVVSILFLTVAGILTICLVYYNRTLVDYDRENAVLTANSAIDYLAQDIVLDDNYETFSEYKPDDKYGGFKKAAFKFDIGSDGKAARECVVDIKRSDDELRLHATCEYNGGVVSLGALLTCEYSIKVIDKEHSVEIETWTFAGYTDM